VDIEAAFAELKRQVGDDCEFERRENVAYIQSGYGPGDDRSAVIIDVEALLRAGLGTK
jgi:hypothetical protein